MHAVYGPSEWDLRLAGCLSFRMNANPGSYSEGLTATHDASFFHDEARRLGNPLRKGIRGSPLNEGGDLVAQHPVIRTNPVTGWKSVYVNRGFTKRINGVSKDESDMILAYLFNLVTQVSCCGEA